MDERPAGWYRDPDNAREHRYWNGQGWMVLETAQSQSLVLQGEDEPEEIAQHS
jgi:Protein of unknown function (DUF2510)